MDAQTVVALVIGIVVALFAPTLAWVLLIAGLRRLHKAKAQETCTTQSNGGGPRS